MAFTYDPYKESQSVKDARDKMNQYQTYKESSTVKDLRNQLAQHNNNKVAEWTGGTYGQQVTDALNSIQNRKAFSYDVNSDALWQQYKDKYTQLGKLAMQDTMGQAAALTGGYGNSYASTAGNQAYQQYLTAATDKIPELASLAMDKYKMEGDQMQQNLANLQSMYNTEYGQYRDAVADWENQRDYLQSSFQNERNFDYGKFNDNRDYYTDAYNRAKDFDYQAYNDNRNFAADMYQFDTNLNWSKEQFNREMANADRDYALKVQQLNEQRAARAAKEKEEKAGSNSYRFKSVADFTKTVPSQTAMGFGYSGDGYTDSYKKYVEGQIKKYYENGEMDGSLAEKLMDYYGL